MEVRGLNFGISTRFVKLFVRRQPFVKQSTAGRGIEPIRRTEVRNPTDASDSG
jgi:hypothetical protein